MIPFALCAVFDSVTHQKVFSSNKLLNQLIDCDFNIEV